MKFTLSVLFMLLLSGGAFSQPINYQFVRYDSIPVNITSNQLDFPWAGGVNYTQFSNIDLNFDGTEDLFVFDRTGNKVLTFLHDGTPNSTNYIYSPSYESFFPAMTNWALLVDYNCDNLPDIFTNSPGGIRIYKNTSSISTGISFQMVESLLYSYYFSGMVNLYVSSVDIPAITDIDYDGDIDILTFSLVGSRIEYHKNYSMENGFGCDSLIYQLKNECWGNFSESILSNTLTLFDTCSTSLPTTELGLPNELQLYNDKNNETTYTTIDYDGIRHSGSCMLAFDNNGINSKDLLIGDISAKNLVYAENGGAAPNLASSIVAQDTLFPSYDIPVNLKTMACAFSVDVNNDGEMDLVVTPQSTAVSENSKGVYYYENTATTNTPTFNFQTASFLQFEMIERGEGALPVLFDYDADGLLDLVISNYGFFNSATDNYTSKLAVLRNNGSSTQPSFIQVNDNFENLSATINDNSLHPSFGDMDNDGDEDMIVGNYTGSLYYFQNIAGAGNTADFVLVQANLTDYQAAIIDIGQYSTPLIVDLDRDGDNDLIIGERNGNLNYYENIGSASVYSFRQRTDTLGGISVNQAGYVTGYSVPAIYDEAGKYQLIIGSQTGYVHHYDSIENNILGSYRMVDTMLLGAPHGIRSGVAVADINGDTEMDIFTGNYRGGLSFFKGDDSGTIGLETLELNTLKIFPNPTHSLVTIEYPLPVELNLSLTDGIGRNILQQKFNQRCQLDLGNLSKGVYLLTIENNGQTFTQKIIRL